MSSLARALLDEIAADPEALAELRSLLTVERPEALLTPSQAAERLGLHPRTVVRMAREGRIDAARQVGKSWRFVAAELAKPTRPQRPHLGDGKPAKPRPADCYASTLAAIRG